MSREKSKAQEVDHRACDQQHQRHPLGEKLGAGDASPQSKQSKCDGQPAQEHGRTSRLRRKLIPLQPEYVTDYEGD